MAIVYDINSDYWMSVYKKIFAKHFALQNDRMSAADIKHALLEHEGIKIITDTDGRWTAIQIETVEDAVLIKLTYAD